LLGKHGEKGGTATAIKGVTRGGGGGKDSTEKTRSAQDWGEKDLVNPSDRGKKKAVAIFRFRKRRASL